MAKRSENILILGLGGVGYYLANRLSRGEHAVTVIESDPDLIRRADGEVDARLIRADAMSFACWKDAHAEKMDYLIAVTDNDAVNITAARIAARCGIREKIARVRSLEIWESDALMTTADFDVDLVIRPEELAAQEILRLLEMRAGNVVVDLADGQMHVLATHVGKRSALSRMTVKDISQKYDDFDFRIVAIARGINTLIPSGDRKVLPRDNVFILARTEDLERLMRLAGVSEERRHRVMIVGGGLIGSRVAQLLEGAFPVRLIEEDGRRAEDLSHLLKRTEVLHGDGSESDTLIKAGLMDMDTIITATGDNETNIMTAVLAKHLLGRRSGNDGAVEGKTIALVKREQYLVLASAMGSDVVLNKKVLAGNEILKHIRRDKMLSVAHLHGCDAEVVEMVADEGSPITRGPLFEIAGMKDRILIGGVFRKGTWQIAIGATHVQAGDKVIAICTSDHLKDLERLFLS